MDRWAFGVSPAPYGLGLTDSAFWEMSHREVFALRKRFIDHQKFQIAMLANLRADVRNSAGSTKQDGSAWQAWDLGADEPKKEQVRRTVSPDRARSYLRSRYGKRMVNQKGEKLRSVLDGVVGQTLPIRKVG